MVPDEPPMNGPLFGSIVSTRTRLLLWSPPAPPCPPQPAKLAARNSNAAAHGARIALGVRAVRPVSYVMVATALLLDIKSGRLEGRTERHRSSSGRETEWDVPRRGARRERSRGTGAQCVGSSWDTGIHSNPITRFQAARKARASFSEAEKNAQ